MATQRVTLAKIGGVSARAVSDLFSRWEQASLADQELPEHVSAAVDQFASELRAHSAELPIVYFTEWIDMWSMFNLVPKLNNRRAVIVAGRRYEACCHRQPVRFKSDLHEDGPTQESQWLKRRIAEARDAWDGLVVDWVLVVLREPLGGLIEDREVEESQSKCPAWLVRHVQ